MPYPPWPCALSPAASRLPSYCSKMVWCPPAARFTVPFTLWAGSTCAEAGRRTVTQLTEVVLSPSVDRGRSSTGLDHERELVARRHGGCRVAARRDRNLHWICVPVVGLERCVGADLAGVVASPSPHRSVRFHRQRVKNARGDADDALREPLNLHRHRRPRLLAVASFAIPTLSPGVDSAVIEDRQRMLSPGGDLRHPRQSLDLNRNV